MPAEKRNAFLDADESDEDVGGYDSEEDIRKGAKRRKIEKRDGEDDDDFSDQGDDQGNGGDGDDEEEGEGEDEHGNSKSALISGEDREEDDEAEDHDDSDGGKSKRKQKLLELPDESKPLAKKNLVATEAAIKKSGVIYISRVPPFMKPQKLRSLLEPYGTINRIFLSPEDPAEHSRRVKNGGNKKRSYTDGWVEFVKKKDAKKAVDLLNARPIGGKKGSFYRDDIWSLLYLNGFKWNNLTEQISAEAAERTSRMRAEISRTTKENKEFVRNVEKGKMLDGIQSKKKKKQQQQQQHESVDGDVPEVKSRRTFEQAAVAKKRGDDKLSEDSKRVASMLF